MKQKERGCRAGQRRLTSGENSLQAVCLFGNACLLDARGTCRMALQRGMSVRGCTDRGIRAPKTRISTSGMRLSICYAMLVICQSGVSECEAQRSAQLQEKLCESVEKVSSLFEQVSGKPKQHGNSVASTRDSEIFLVVQQARQWLSRDAWNAHFYATSCTRILDIRNAMQCINVMQLRWTWQCSELLQSAEGQK